MAEQQQGGEALRYRLLDTVRQYGWEKLSESGEGPTMRRHQANFFLKFAERVESKINSKDRGVWLERLEVEHDNLRAALTWSRAEEAEGETGLRLAGALSWFWFHHGYWSEGLGWLRGTLARATTRTAALAKALYGMGLLAWTTGDHAVARSQLEESVELWRKLGDRQSLAHPQQFLSMEVLGQGEPAAARSLAEESVAIFREGEDTFGLAVSLTCIGTVALVQEDYAAARSFLEESVVLFRGMEDMWGLGLPLRNLGIVAFRQGDHDRAAALLGESLIVLRELGEKWFISRSIETLAVVASMQSDHVRAARLFGAGEALREAVGASVLPFYQVDYDRGVAAARAGLDEAAFSAAWTEGRALSPEQTIEYALSKEEEPVLPPAPKTTSEAPASSYPGGLSAREAEVLKLVAKGLTKPQIAQQLFISPRTVGRHLGSILSKIEVNSRAAATRFAAEHGLN